MARKVMAKDVAALAGVSPATVTRAFQSGSPVGDETRERVLKAARSLRYAPPSQRGADRVSSGTITIIAGDLTNPFYPDVVGRMSRVFQERGKRSVLQAVTPGASIEMLVEHVLEFRTDAVILMSATMSSELARACRRQSIPVLLFNRLQIDEQMSAVTCDNHGGGMLAARRFLATGRRRIAMIDGTLDASTQIERRRGFVDALAEAGVAMVAEATAQFDYRSGLAAAEQLLAGSATPDAVFACNDIMALAVIDAAKARGLRIPDEIAVIGFDDIPMGAWESYRLTTIRQPVDQMVADIADLLDAQLKDPERSGSIRIAPVKLIARSSG